MARSDKYTITEGTLTDIGDAIRAKTGKSALIDPVDMPSEIGSISGGGSGELSKAYKSLSLLFSNGYKADPTDPYHLIIPTGFSEVRDYACYSNPQITALSFETPNTITRIGQRAFQYCQNLVSVKLPESLTTIDMMAFLNCNNPSFNTISIPASVTSIGASVFQGCSGLTTVYIKGGWNGSWVTISIAAAAFSSSSITDIYVPWPESANAQNKPWGATNATIHYDTVYGDDGLPITS